MSHNILVVDDEIQIREMLKEIVIYQGHTCYTASDGNTALSIIKEKRPCVVILDIWLQDSELDGIGVLEFIKQNYPLTIVIMMSGHGTGQMVRDAMKIGAYDYIEKPFDAEKMIITIENALEKYMLSQNRELKNKNKNSYVGNSQAVSIVRAAIDRIAPTSCRVLISGPTGSGKEMSARAIHAKSKRNAANLVFFRAQNYDSSKILIELFGEQSGEMIESKKIPAIERAHNGTLVIDEVTMLPEKAQSDLLKFLQTGKVVRDGGREITSDVRIISTTRYNIENLISEGKFNGDLYYRLSVEKLSTPALNDFKEDIPLLCDYFVKQFIEIGLPYKKFSEEVITQLQLMDWEGNVRQLKNYLESLYLEAHKHGERYITKLATVKNDNNVDKDAKAIWFDAEAVMRMPLREARETFERYYLTAQIQRFGGNISKTSNFVGMERSALHRKLKSLNVISPLANDEKELDEEFAESETA